MPVARPVLVVVAAVSAALMPALAGASPWRDDPQIQLADDGYVTQKVELVDVNHDGWVDIVFANSSGDATGSEQSAQLNQLFINNGDGTGFTAQGEVFETPDNAYAIKAGDLDNDGDADLVVGVNFAGTSYVLIHEDGELFTPQNIGPSADTSIGDLELGDVDGDGDLDIVATDWGTSMPHGEPDDLGAPVRLWLGNGDGTFTAGDMNLPLGMENRSSWSFDLELVDIDGDHDLDVMVSNRGVGWALVFENDGSGLFSTFDVPALAGDIAKQDNASFTPMDFNGDGAVDILSLQDGVGQGGDCIDVMGVQYCARRNSVLINDGTGQFADNPGGAWWTALDNPPRLDFDAATLDFDSDGVPDFVTTGLRVDPMDIHSRLFMNDGTKFTLALDAAFPLVPELAHSFGLMFADFDHDGREDVAVAQRDAVLPNYVLFGSDDPLGGIAEDTSPPRIYDDNLHDKLGSILYFGDHAEFTARVDDYKTPTHWHDYLYEGSSVLEGLNLIGDGAKLTAHGRRLPYMEFALGLANPDDILDLADDDPSKYIAPSIWFGEALWRVGFTVPDSGKLRDTLTWQYCAIDAAGNRACLGPFQITIARQGDDCGDGIVQEWETCDSNSPTCLMCEETCDNGICDPNENDSTCQIDCGRLSQSASDGPECGDGVCDGFETVVGCPSDCSDCDGVCSPTGGELCPDDCEPLDTSGAITTGEPGTSDETGTTDACPDGGSPGSDGRCQSDGDGCGCVTDPKDSRGLWASLLLLGVVGVRRSRKRA